VFGHKTVQSIALTGAVLLTGLIVWGWLVGSRGETTIPVSAITTEQGFAYLASLPRPTSWLFESSADGPQWPERSTLQIFENGRRLGPAHSQHETIRRAGRGGFSHWGEVLYFSASDNSDPRINGRIYSMTTRAKLVGSLGAALVVIAWGFVFLSHGLLAGGRLRQKFNQTWRLAKTFPEITRDRVPAVFRVAAIAVSIYGTLRIMRAIADRTYRPLWPDVQHYKSISLQLEAPFETGLREPLVIWITKLAMVVWGTGDVALRFAGGALFLACAWLVYRVTRSVGVHQWIALLAAFLFVNHGFVLELGAEGIRDIHLMASLLLFTYVCSEIMQGRMERTRAAIGVSGALLITIGIRMTAFPALFVLAALVFWKARISWRWAVPALIAPVLFIAPYLVHCKQAYGDYLFAVNVHAIWWKNYEFVTSRKQGCLGCPSQDALNAQGYYQGRATALGYVFGMRSPAELARDTVIGLARTMVLPTVDFKLLYGHGAFALWAVYLIGLLRCLLDRKKWLLFLVPVTVLAPLFFTLMIDMDRRLFSPAAPYMTIIAAVGVSTLMLWLREGIRFSWTTRSSRR